LHGWRERQGLVQRVAIRYRFALEILRQDEVVVLEHAFELGREPVGIEQILDAQRPPRDLVFVGRTDATAGGADARVAQRSLARLIESDVIGHDQRAGRRDRQP
jgi:hypothetical protein